jgi:alkyl sulfatase BDS1-like metallo-beta-lactamase superfamily hydrolase
MHSSSSDTSPRAGPWRSFYLTGAQELRNGTPNIPGLRGAARIDGLRAMTPEMVLDNCGVKLDGPAATDIQLAFDITFVAADHGADVDYRVTVANGVLRYGSRRVGRADATVRTTVEALVKVTSEASTVDEELLASTMSILGDRSAFDRFVELLDQFDLFFPIIEP